MFGFDNMFNGCFKPIAKGMCKLGVNGKLAIKTSTGFKTYDLDHNKLTNCSNFGFDADGCFWVVPTFKVVRGDVILVNGRPHCVIKVEDDMISAFNYEDSTIVQIVPEHHVFMGKTYCYGKIFSPFMNMGKSDTAMSNMMNMMMMSQMFGGADTNSSMNPMMFMMMGDNGFEDLFDGAFDFCTEDSEEE